MKTIIMATTVQYILSIAPNYFGETRVEGRHSSSGIEYFVVIDDYYDDGIVNPY